MLFDFPHDFSQETWKTSWVIVPNMFVLTMFLASLYPAWIARNAVPPQIWSILMFAAIAFIGSSFLSAYNLMFSILVPILCIWTSYVWIRLVRFEIHLGKSGE
jgi:accessory gene regulator protein AgrB